MRFFNISRGSLEECRYYLILVSDLKIAKLEEEKLQLEDVSRLLERYTQRIRQDLLQRMRKK